MTEPRRSPLSEEEATLLSKLSADGRSIFNCQEAMERFGKGYGYLVKLLHSMNRKGWIDRLKPGLYIIIPLDVRPGAEYTEDSLLIASRLAEPSYISYWSALNHYGWTEQPSSIVYSATRKLKKNFFIHNIEYYFTRVSERKFFGFRKEWVGSSRINIAEKEKAIIDAFDKIALCGGIVESAKSLSNAKDELDWQKLLQYGLRAGNKAVLQRIGLLTEREGLAGESILTGFNKAISNSYALLDPTRKPEGRHHKKWNIVMNVPSEELDGWKGY